MVGENLGKKCVFVFVLVVVIITLEHDTSFVIVSGLGNTFFSCLSFYKFISWVVLESMLSRPLSCHSYVQEKSYHKQSPPLSQPYVVINSYYVGLPFVSFKSFSYFDLPQICYLFRVIGGNQGPIVTSLFMSTSNHYPGTRLRNHLVP
jgi:hypothetical protein